MRKQARLTCSAAGDQIIVLAEDDDTYGPTEEIPMIDTGPAPTNFKPKRRPEKVLFVGWRRDMDDMIVVSAHTCSSYLPTPHHRNCHTFLLTAS